MLKNNYSDRENEEHFLEFFYKFIHSIRFRIMAAIIIAGVLPLLVMEQSVINSYHQEAIRSKNNDIQSYLNQAARTIGQKNAFIDEKADIGRESLSSLSDVFDSRIIVVNGQMRIVYDSYMFEEGKTLISTTVIQGLKGKTLQENPKSGDVTELAVTIQNTENQGIGVIIAYVNQGEFRLNLKKAERELYVVRILLIVAVVIVAFFFSGLLVEPVENITASIREFSQGYKTRVSESEYSEIKELSGEFNKLFGRMAQLDESRQEFVSNVSHELKTPMTSIKVLADSLNGQKDVPIELYQEFMEDITKEIDRENKIINDLLTLVRMDKTEVAMNISRVRINDLVEAVLKRIVPIASRQNIEITYESYRDVVADVDEVKLTLAVTNLVENAIKYNKKDGWVKVSLNADHKYFYIQVEDSGIGIPEDQQDKIFDRFYRVDKTRSRETGGTGLGLSIARETVLMHHGQMKLQSKENEGSKFIMRVPLIYVGGDGS
ncbi:MAG: ATP-binding protein [Lachnospiraceae bacterium]